MKYLCFLIISFSMLASQAQQKEKQRSCRVIFLGDPGGAPESAHLFDGIASHEITLSDMTFSDVVDLPAGALTLGVTPEHVVEPEKFPVGAPTLKVPATLENFYIIAVTDRSNSILPLKMQAVDAGNKLKPGQTLWINLTTHAIAGKLGKETLRIPSGTKVIGKAPLASSGYYRATFAYQPAEGDGFLPVMKKSWWFDATSKNLGFVTESGGRIPKIFTIRDHREPEAGRKTE